MKSQAIIYTCITNNEPLGSLQDISRDGLYTCNSLMMILMQAKSQLPVIPCPGRTTAGESPPSTQKRGYGPLSLWVFYPQEFRRSSVCQLVEWIIFIHLKPWDVSSLRTPDLGASFPRRSIYRIRSPFPISAELPVHELLSALYIVYTEGTQQIIVYNCRFGVEDSMQWQRFLSCWGEPDDHLSGARRGRLVCALYIWSINCSFPVAR